MMVAAIEDDKRNEGPRLVPVCAYCGRFRSPRGDWRPAAAGLCLDRNVDVTHTLCPRCIQRLYPAFYRRHRRGPDLRK